MNYKEEMEEIQALECGQCAFVNMCNEGGAQIWKQDGYYTLFEIPLFGGEPIFYGDYTFEDIDHMFEELYSWA